jgi:hypothetical protein
VFGLRRLDSRTRWLLLLPCITVAITTLVFYGGHRIRSSMEPTVVVAAALAIGGLIDGRSITRARRTRRETA